MGDIQELLYKLFNFFINLKLFQNKKVRTSLVVRWFRVRLARQSTGSIPGWGTRILGAGQTSKQINFLKREREALKVQEPNTMDGPCLDPVLNKSIEKKVFKIIEEN